MKMALQMQGFTFFIPVNMDGRFKPTGCHTYLLSLLGFYAPFTLNRGKKEKHVCFQGIHPWCTFAEEFNTKISYLLIMQRYHEGSTHIGKFPYFHCPDTLSVPIKKTMLVTCSNAPPQLLLIFCKVLNASVLSRSEVFLQIIKLNYEEIQDVWPLFLHFVTHRKGNLCYCMNDVSIALWEA